MATLLQISHLNKAYFTQEIFRDAEVVIAEKQKIGVIGRNGAGKSTLFKMIVGDETPDSGEIKMYDIARLGYLEQHDTADKSLGILSYLELASGRESWQCAKVAGKFELKHEQLEAPLGSLSGGYQMRVKLAAMLLKEPNLFLLDEPTNYLDVHTQLLLEQFLRSYQGAFLIISHDREFLRRTCTETLEVEHGELFLYPGNVEEYFAYKEEQLEMKSRYNKKIDREQKHLQAFVDRFRFKASKASQAQSKLKAIAKLSFVDIASPLRTVHITIPAIDARKGLAFKTNKLSIGYPTKTVAEDIRLEIERGEHVAIVGDNGQGKTTFFKTIAGELPELSGTFSWGHGATLAYYAQHVPHGLPENADAWTYLRTHAPLTIPDQEVLKMAGNFLFDKDALEKKIKVLSGGERARLCLASLLLSGSNTLLLDEPTNHLDFETVEALGQALEEFNGTVLFISHNRTFVDSVATSVIEVNGGTVRRYADGYESYIANLEKNIQVEAGLPTTPVLTEAQVAKQNRKLSYEEMKERKKELRAIENDIATLEKQKEILQKKQAANPPAFSWQDYASLADVERVIEERERQWLELQEK